MDNMEHLIDNNNNYKYKQAEFNEFSALRHSFLENSRLSAEVFKHLLNLSKIGTCDDTVATIIEQVRRRTLYFHIFHEPNGLNEAKETALYVFWILKLQPFYWKGREGRLYSNNVLNAKMAMSFLIRGLDFYAIQKSQNGVLQCKLNISDYIIKNLIHSFIYRDISKEALMDLAESLIINKILPESLSTKKTTF